MDIKGRDGTATLTDEYLEFRFSFGVRTTKLTRSVRVPLTRVERLEYDDNQLRVRAKGWSFTPEPKADGLTFRFNPDGSGDELAATLSEATGVPFTDLTTGDLQWREEWKEQMRRERPQRRLVAPAGSFQGYYFEGRNLVHGASRWAVAGATASVDGTSSERSSTGRTIGGALVGGVLAGGAGAVVGAMAGSGATKDTSKRYLTIVTTDGTVVILFPPMLETQARAFAARVNSWGR
ncbi:hypothetical protein DEJ30_08095 [Curtobacterium sp. MCPF17_003]|uniref:hypothetical protein n=1 Tax=Curtobacterium sp. MCPF17_003 TaxID=2175637 RepID=UPI000D987561|nr:hypothetical protein [Curtobacterium sp. MCPF17_003]PYY64416.1 hypothetical protein DEJ30_08095 [Curtobacterium sp. MCPF17_003]